MNTWSLTRLSGLIERGILTLLAGLCPILFTPGSQDMFRPPKLLLIQECGLLLLLFGATRVLIGGRLFHKDALSCAWTDLRSNPWIALLLLLLGWLGLSTLQSSLPWVSMKSFGTLLAYAGIIWAASRNCDVKLARRIALISIAAGWLNAILALLQLAGKDTYFLTAAQAMNALKARLFIIGFAGNPNWLSPYILFSLILSLTLLFLARSRTEKLFHLLSSLLFVGVLFVSQTFAALATLLLVGSVVAYWTLRNANLNVMKTMAAFGLLVVLGAGGILSTRLFGGEFRERMDNLQTSIMEGNWDRLLTGRYFAWIITREMILDRPFIGFGLGLFPRYDFQYEAEYPRIDHFEFIPPQKGFDETHNDYLQVWSETGLIGLLLTLSALGLYATHLWRWLMTHSESGRLRSEKGPGHSSKSHPSRLMFGLTAGWGTVVLAGAINAMANFPLHVAYLACPLALGLGFTARFAGLYPQSRGPEREGSLARLSVGAIMLAGLAILATSCGVWFWNSYRAVRIRGELVSDFKELNERRRAGSAATPRSLELANGMVSKASLAVELDPWDSHNYLDLGRAYALSERNDPASEALEKELELRPHVDIYVQLAATLTDMGDLGMARQMARTALRLHPSEPRAQEILIWIGERMDRTSYPAPVQRHKPPLAIPRYDAPVRK